MKTSITFLVLVFSYSALAETKTAVFAAGCFWCIQPPYNKADGVISTRVGYTGGELKNPNYQQVSYEKTGHIEAIEVTYDDTKTSYEKLLKIFWQNIDPYDGEGQFCDKGSQYVSAIFYQGDQQKEAAIKSKVTSGFELQKIKTLILAAKNFWPAEDYHQNYYKKNPLRYKFYRYNCGRDKRLKELK